jgi:branched-chain amino acid transport system substrate-binding protein
MRKHQVLWILLGIVMFAACLGVGLSSAASRAKLAPIVIGDVSDQSGPVASSGGGWLPGLEAWAAWTNANGGLVGHRVELVARDAKGDPATYVAQTQAVLGMKHLAAFIPGSTLGFLPIHSLINARRIPAIGGYQDDLGFIQSPYSFPEMTTVDATTYADAKVAVLDSKKTGLVFYCAESPICAETIPLWKQGAAKAGSGWQGSIEVSASTPDYTAQCLAARAKGADWIALGQATAVVPRITADCKRNGYNPLWILTAYDSSFLSDPSMNGARYAFPTALYDTPAAATFRAAMAKYEKAFLSSPEYGTWTYAAWITGQIVAQAVKLADPTGTTVTAADVLRGLYMFKKETLGGQTPPLTYKRGAGHTVGCFFPGEISNGKLVSLSSGPVC